MSSKELLELGRLIVDFPIQYVALKRLEIKDTYNQHGILTLELIAAKVLQEKDVLRLQNTPIKIATPSGETIFCGICEAVHLNSEAMYTEATIVARSLSAQTDIKKNSRTFQNPGKTISQVAQTVMSAYGSVVEVKEDINLPDMLNQSQETDWAFLKRIAGQYGFVLFTDCKSSTLKISIGPVGFGQKTLDDSAYSVGMSKSVDGYICTKNNISSEASACEYEEGNYQSYDLSIGSGYLLPESKQVVMSSKITSQRGTVTNFINLKREEGTYASFKEAAEPVLTANIISGTVLEVNQNEIKVHFDVDSGQSLGEARWIPYENELNNYVYSMPDIGDKVFVYYDKQGKVIGMGSKRTDESGHPDYDHPENKSLTSCDKMIKFTPNTIEWVGSRGYYDAGDGSYQAEITFDNEAGISLYSTHDILIDTKSKGHGSVIIHAAEDFIEIKEPPQTFEGMEAAGKAKYEADGGIPLWQQQQMAINAEGNAIVKQFTEGVKGMVTGPFQIFSTLESIFVPQKELKSVTPEVIEMFETGVIYLMSQNQVKFTVGESSITLSNAWINIKTPVYRHLGFEKKQYEQQSMPNRTWLDTILDGEQLVLDIVGCLPIPIVGEVADLVNAGISLARGDYFGAAASLISAIPGGDIIGKGMKVAKAAAKGAKYLDKVETIIRVTRIICTGAQTLNGILVNRDQIAEVFTLMKEGKFDITNQEHWDMLIEASRATVLPMVQCGVAVHNKRKSDKRRKQEAEAANKSKTEAAEGTNKPANTDQNVECASGADPINLVTGSFLVDEIDFYLEDLGAPFYIKRTYESIYTNTQQLLGSKWLINIGSYIAINNQEAVVLMPDTHIEKFKKDDNKWINERKADQSITLKETSDGYRVESIREHLVYVYNRQGNIETIIDRNHNRTCFNYTNKLLTSIRLASNQSLVFEYEHNKIVTITDAIGRQLKYVYEGELLTQVIYPHGGSIQYTYTLEGYIESITNQNGKVYLTNQYDRKGRVTRQNLSNGEEYILLYNEADFTNTLITTSKNQRVNYQYNRDKLVTKTTYSDGTYKEVAYDEWQNVIYERDRMGREIHRRYNERCLLLEEKLPQGLITQYVYDKEEYLIKHHDNAGGEVQLIYDGQHNLIEKKTKLDELSFVVEQFKYDVYGRKIAYINPNGEQTTYYYDKPFNQPTAYINGEAQRFDYVYDEVGRNMAISSEYGKVSFAYNHRDHKTMIIDEQGYITKYDYDKMGNVIKEILPNAYDPVMGVGPCMRYSYNDLGKRIRTVDQLGNVFAVTRNTEGKITKEIHPNTYEVGTNDGAGIIYIYDEDDRQIKAIYPNGGVERTKYDANGNIIKIIQPESYDEKIDDGPGYEYEYDKANCLTQIMGPDGKVQKRFIYNSKGHIVKEIDAKGYFMGADDDSRIGTLYTYNLLGWLLEERVPVKEEEGSVLYKVTQYTYSMAGDLIEEKHYGDYQDSQKANGSVHTIKYDYDKERHLTKVSDCTGAVVEYRYDCLGQRIYEKRKINETTNQVFNYKYDAHGHLLEVTKSADKEGTGRRFVTTRYTYDSAGNLLKIVSPKGYVVERFYDTANRLIEEKHFDQVGGIDNQMTLQYDKAGNLIALTDREGHSLLYRYDLMNREIMKTDQVGGVTRTFYNKNGQIIKQIQPNQYVTLGDEGAGLTYTYDLCGRITEVRNAVGQIMECNTYNEVGELSSKLDAMKEGVHYRFDLGGRTEAIETTGGSTQSYVYDARGNIVDISDGNNQNTKYRLDKWGRIIEVQKADQSKEHYEYDLAGNIVVATDANEHTITYRINNLNKLAEIIDQDGNQETFSYDAEGHLCETVNRNGIRIKYDYNMYGSLTSRREMEGGLCESYHYYPDGKLKAAIAEGMRYDYTYYPNNLLKEKSASGRTLLAYTYDLNGNKQTQIDVQGKTTKYSYNVLDELIEIVDNEVKLARYNYYPDGRVKNLRQLNGLETAYSYDKDKNLAGLEVTLDGKKLVQNGYTYDGNGNRLEKNQLQGKTLYSYDSLNRVTKVVYPTHAEELYYDQAGNRTKRITRGTEELYSYDTRNRLMSLIVQSEAESRTIHYEYDNQGNLLKDSKANYTYDGFNRTQKVETFDGSVQVNHYDAEGLRYEIEENGKLVQFIFSNREVAVEQTENDTIRLIRGYDITASESQQARTYYHYVSDEQGSTTHIFEEQEIRNYYEYDAFGNLATCEEMIHNRFKYTGQQYDPITQQYYLRARYYNPVIARFTQEDAYRGDGLNLYAYCANNPVIYYDPSGYAAKAICPGTVSVLQKKVDSGEQLKKNEQKQYDRYKNEYVNGDEKQREKYEKDRVKENGKQEKREEKNAEKQREKQKQYENNVNELAKQYEKQGYTVEQAKQRAVADQAARDVNMNGRSPAEIAKNKGYDGVKTTANGGADFSGTEYMYQINGKDSIVSVEMTGNRGKDFKAANEAVGLTATPDGYVWHHVDDYDPVTGKCTIQLVMDEAHDASKVHSGSCAQYDAINGKFYNK